MMKVIPLCTAIFAGALSVVAQGTVETTPANVANSKRLAELWRHPTFVTLRLASTGRELPREEPTTTPRPYTNDEWLRFELFITQNGSETLTIANNMWPYREYRPELIRDGDIVSYSKQAQENIERAEREPPNGSMVTRTLEPGRESQCDSVSLEDWYESPFRPGHYQLIVRKRFVGDGDWVESNPVTFDVIPRRPAALIPDGISIRLVPRSSLPQAKGEGRVYRMTNDDYFDVVVVNDSDQVLRINIVDELYGNRLQLFKDKHSVPYTAEATEDIKTRDLDPRRVAIGDIEVPPKSSFASSGLAIRRWYGSLPPGVYRLTNRRRFEIAGPWTKSSAELLIEIIR